MTSWLVMERDSVGRRGDGLVFNFHETGVPVGSTQIGLLASKHQSLPKPTPSVAPHNTQETQDHTGFTWRCWCLGTALPWVLSIVERY